LLLMLPTVAVKVAVVAPEATVTEAGTLTAALLLESDTTAPPLGAACDIVTVHVDVLPELTVAGLQPTLLRLVVEPPLTAILPPVPVAEMPVPLAAPAETLVTPMFTVPDAVPERVTLTTATTPFPIAVWLRAETKQVSEPLLFEQVSDLDAAVDAAPMDTLKLATLAAL
jgi:hypothetical protein